MVGRLEPEALGAPIASDHVSRTHITTLDSDIQLVARVFRPSLFRSERDAWIAGQQLSSMPRVFHPRVVQVVEAGLIRMEASAAEVPYLVTPRIDSETLRTRLNTGGPLPLATKLDLSICLAEALAGLHDAAIVHGALDPHCVSFDSTGKAQLTGYGLGFLSCHALDAKESNHTRQTEYAAPEQLCLGAPLDRRADIFSLGALLHELFFGSIPFAHLPLDARLDTELRGAIDSSSSNTPREVTDVLRAMCCADREDRHLSAAAVADAFRDIQVGCVVGSTPRQRKSIERPLIGTRGIVRTFDRMLTDLHPGVVPVLDIVGDSGIGKSTVLAALGERAQADRDTRVVHLAFEDRQEEGLDDVVARALSQSDSSTATEPQDGLNAIRWMPRAVVLVDDVQWAPSGSVERLRTLMTRCGPRRALVVVARRPDVISAPSPKTRTAQDEDERCVLVPWNQRDSLRFLRQRCQSREASRILLEPFSRRTSGVPLLAHHWLEAQISRGVLRPTAGGELVVRSLDALEQDPSSPPDANDGWLLDHVDPEARRLIDVAACDGMRWDVPTLATVSGVDRDRAYEWTRHLLQAGVLRSAGEEDVRFSHYRIRDAALADLPAAARRRLHRSLWDVYRTRHEAEGAEHSMELVRAVEHALASDLDNKPSGALIRSLANFLMSQHRAVHALKFLRRALAAPTALVDRDRVEAMLDCAQATQFVGDVLDSDRLDLQAVELAQRIGARDLEALALQRAYCRDVAEGPARALPLLAREVMHSAHESGVARYVASASLALTRSDLLHGNTRRAIGRSTAVLAMSESDIGADLHMSAGIQLLEAMSVMGCLRQELTQARHVIRRCEVAHEPSWEVIARWRCAHVHLALGAPRTALTQFAKTRTRSESIGWAMFRSTIAMGQAEVHLAMGLTGSGLRLIRYAQARAEASNDSIQLRDIGATHGRALLYAGRWGEARDVLESTVRADRAQGHETMGLEAQELYARTLLSLGRRDAAIRELQDARRTANMLSARRMVAAIDVSLGDALRDAGRNTAACSHYRNASAYYAKFDGGIARHVHAVCRLAEQRLRHGDRDGASRMWRQARSISDNDGLRHLSIEPVAHMIEQGLMDVGAEHSEIMRVYGRVPSGLRLELLGRLSPSHQDFADAHGELKEYLLGRVPAGLRARTEEHLLARAAL